MKNEKTIYALGFFDGVHLGHQALLAACRSLAEQTGAKPGVVTFAGHPDTILSGNTPPFLNTMEDRERLLRQYGMETVRVLPFDENLMRMPWQEFFRLLREEYGAAGLVCGWDFRFGYRGEGTAEKLKAACEASGIPCAVVPQQTVDGIRVSSTHIRALIENGEMEAAVKFLGHPHILTGVVQKGATLGRKMGTPTANLVISGGQIVPKFGVYACRISTDQGEFLAVTNVGTRPTVAGEGITVEPWILDFQGDLYEKKVTLSFYAFLRPEKKFPSLSELQAEIQKNALQTREFFNKM
jgi:riboflavin kinase/FMN adenylyltransferase